jgi:hypothetical protein
MSKATKLRVDVKKKDEKDDDELVIVDDEKNKALLPLKQIRVHLAGKVGKKPVKNGKIRVTLWQKISQSSASGGAVSVVSALQPASSDEWTQFAALYDVARCRGVKIYVFAGHGGTTSTDASWISTFDPDNSAVLASIISGLAQRHHTGPVVNMGLATGSAFAVTPTGFHVYHAKTARSFESSVSADKAGGNWFPTSSTTAIIGYIKPYAEAVASQTWFMVHFVGYDMEFEFRG